MRQVVAYATARGIRVVPEIDMPGHASSIAVAYPDLMSAPGPYRMEREWGVHKPTLDPTRDEVYQFVDTIVGELAAIFPDPYLHIGGDEVDASQWRASPSIQAFMQKNGLADTHALQAYFNQKLEKILEKHQRQMVGWDEIYHPSLPRSIVIQSWQGQDSLAPARRTAIRASSPPVSTSISRKVPPITTAMKFCRSRWGSRRRCSPASRRKAGASACRA